MSQFPRRDFLDSVSDLFQQVPQFTTPNTASAAPSWGLHIDSSCVLESWFALDESSRDPEVLHSVSNYLAQVSTMAVLGRAIYARIALHLGDEERTASFSGVSRESITGDATPRLRLVSDPSDPERQTGEFPPMAPFGELDRAGATDENTADDEGITTELKRVIGLLHGAFATVATATPGTDETFALAARLVSAAGLAADAAQSLHETAVGLDDRMAEIAAQLDIPDDDCDDDCDQSESVETAPEPLESDSDPPDSESADQSAAAKVAEPETSQPDPPVGRSCPAVVASVSLAFAAVAAMVIIAVALSHDTAEPHTVVSGPSTPPPIVAVSPAAPTAEPTKAGASAQPDQPDLEEQGERLTSSEPESEPVPAAIGETETERTQQPARKAKRRDVDRQFAQAVASDQGHARTSAREPRQASSPYATLTEPVRVSVPMGTVVEIEPEKGAPYMIAVQRRVPRRRAPHMTVIPRNDGPAAPTVARLPISGPGPQIEWRDTQGATTLSLEIAGP